MGSCHGNQVRRTVIRYPGGWAAHIRGGFKGSLHRFGEFV